MDENLEMVAGTVAYLRDNGRKVIFDAEHFFDGYKANPDYAVSVTKAAAEGGAQLITLCDTNGGSMTSQVKEITSEVAKKVKKPLGIHTHNDSGLGTANTIAAVEAGARHIQGTINGLGERCGNADLCEIIPTLMLKMGFKALRTFSAPKTQLSQLTKVSKYVYELANMPPDPYQPYVGLNAFAHKGGVHIDAVLKTPEAYEHVSPDLVGNMRRLSISELAGKAAVLQEAEKLGIELDKNSTVIRKVLAEIKELESQGHYLENALATVHLVILKALGRDLHPFRLVSWSATARSRGKTESIGEVTVKVGPHTHTERAKGEGPVHAIDLALRKAILHHFPKLRTTELQNYKVTVVDSGNATASKVRVFIEFRDGNTQWATTALSRNVIDASIQALTDGYIYRLVLNNGE